MMFRRKQLRGTVYAVPFFLAILPAVRYNSRKGCSRGFIGVAGGDSEEDIIWLRV